VCLGVYLKSRRFVLALVSIGIVILFVVAVFPWGDLTARFGRARSDFRFDRALQYRIALELTYEHPWSGPGLERFVSHTRARIGTPLEPHSNVLGVMVSSGAIGLGALFWLAGRYITLVHRGLSSMRSSRLRTYAIGFFAGFVGYQVQGLLVGNLGWFVMWVVGAVPLCCIASEGEQATLCYMKALEKHGSAKRIILLSR